MSTEITTINIGTADRSNDVLRVELWRTVSAVGNWVAYLRNTDGQFNGVFDVQDQFLLNVDGPANTLMQGRVDGPAVTIRGQDSESDWDEYAIIKGVDQAQDLLFHNDFDYDYPDVEAATQTAQYVFNDVINTQLAGLTNITYANTMPDVTPVVGSIEFREGTNFLATTQDLFRRAGYIFYVDDVLAFQSGVPALAFNPTGVTLNSVAGSANNNILDIVDLQERDGDKHYNYIKFYGKNPMFDGYTEGNAASWTALPAGQLADALITVERGMYSILVWNNNPVDTHISLVYTLPQNNYTSFDFTKGELGIWAYYDDTAGAPGTPGAGSMGAGGPGGVWPWNVPTCLWVRLTDGAARTAEYFGTSTMMYRGVWGWCSFPLGQNGGAVASAQNVWFLSNPAFDWSDITAMWFRVRPGGGFAAANYPSHLYLDGITMPEPCIAVAENVPAQQTGALGGYRRRPYVGYRQHLNTQNSLNLDADKFLAQVESTSINKVSLVTEGNLALRYAGQSVTVNIPSLGLNSEVMYITQLHHIIEPYKDVSSGFGFDWITEVDAVPISGVAYDMGRLKSTGFMSASQAAASIGTGARVK